MNVSWSTFKTVATDRGLSVQWLDLGDSYELKLIDGMFILDCNIPKSDTANTADFETGLKLTGNKKLAPKDSVLGREIVNTSAFAINTDFEVKATGYRGTAAAGVSTNLDFAVGSEDRYVNGINLIIHNAADADTIGFKVVDVNNVLGYGAGLVLKTFGTNWNIDHTKADQGREVFNFVARLPAGVYVRVVYNSTGETAVTVKLNLLLHKKVA